MPQMAARALPLAPPDDGGGLTFLRPAPFSMWGGSPPPDALMRYLPSPLLIGAAICVLLVPPEPESFVCLVLSPCYPTVQPPTRAFLGLPCPRPCLYCLPHCLPPLLPPIGTLYAYLHADAWYTLNLIAF